jgi:hypothetical protein
MNDARYIFSVHPEDLINRWITIHWYHRYMYNTITSCVRAFLLCSVMYLWADLSVIWYGYATKWFQHGNPTMFFAMFIACFSCCISYRKMIMIGHPFVWLLMDLHVRHIASTLAKCSEAIIAVAEGKCKLNDVSQEFPLTNISTVRNHVDAYHEGDNRTIR